MVQRFIPELSFHLVPEWKYCQFDNTEVDNHLDKLLTWSNDGVQVTLCTGQIEASTSTPGIPRVFDCDSCPGRGEFELCLERVGNLNQICLLF